MLWHYVGVGVACLSAALVAMLVLPVCAFVLRPTSRIGATVNLAMRTKVIATTVAAILLIGAALGWALTRSTPEVVVDGRSRCRDPACWSATPRPGSWL